MHAEWTVRIGSFQDLIMNLRGSRRDQQVPNRGMLTEHIMLRRGDMCAIAGFYSPVAAIGNLSS